jgi:hypothetical protein
MQSYALRVNHFWPDVTQFRGPDKAQVHLEFVLELVHHPLVNPLLDTV